jgi:hypothetical protein
MAVLVVITPASAVNQMPPTNQTRETAFNDIDLLQVSSSSIELRGRASSLARSSTLR